MEVTEVVEEATRILLMADEDPCGKQHFLLPKCFEENHYFCYTDIDCMIGKLPVQAWSSVKKPVWHLEQES